MGEYNEALGRQFIVEVEGKEWRLSAVTPNVCSEFENWIESGVRQGIVVQKQHFGPDDYAAAIENFGRNVFLKKYRWGGEICREVILSNHGWLKLFSLLLKKYHGEETKHWKLDDFTKLYYKNFEQFKTATGFAIDNPKDEDSPEGSL